MARLVTKAIANNPMLALAFPLNATFTLMSVNPLMIRQHSQAHNWPDESHLTASLCHHSLPLTSEL